MFISSIKEKYITDSKLRPKLTRSAKEKATESKKFAENSREIMVR
jgi:hypothetical protein